MQHKKEGPPELPTGYRQIHSRQPAGEGGALVREYAAAPPDRAVLTARLCAWLANRKETDI